MLNRRFRNFRPTYTIRAFFAGLLSAADRTTRSRLPCATPDETPTNNRANDKNVFIIHHDAIP
jgi:hypothetical protein